MNQNLTWDCLLISVFLTEFSWSEPKNRTILGSDQANSVKKQKSTNDQTSSTYLAVINKSIQAWRKSIRAQSNNLQKVEKDELFQYIIIVSKFRILQFFSCSKKYRVSRQLVLTFNFNSLLSWWSYEKANFAILTRLV